MDNQRETQEVMVYIRKATLVMDPLLRLTGIGTIKLIQFFARMAKEHKLSKHKFKDFQEFAKLTGGDYSIVNIPVPAKGEASQSALLEELQKKGIRYSTLPDLDGGGHYIQIAVMNEDRELFQAWNRTYLEEHMRGGEHTKDVLEAFTSGRASLVSVPFEGKEDLFREDFQKLGINYAVMPDLRVGDGKIQLLVSDLDMQKMEHWYRLYRDDRMKAGEEVPDLEKMDMESYMKTGEMTEDEYMDTAAEELKEMNRKYEREPGEAEEAFQRLDFAVKPEESEAFLEFDRDDRYQKFTINDKTLVSSIPDGPWKRNLEDQGYFVSLIPAGNTPGGGRQFLVLPRDQVFLAADRMTYTAFAEKDKAPLILDSRHMLVRLEQRPTAKELFDSHYVIREPQGKPQAEKAAGAAKKARKKTRHIPDPVKAK